MSTLEDYANKYRTIRMERRHGILQMTLHTDGGSLRWGFVPHGELPDAFYDVGRDRDNRVVIITGTGAEFSGPRATPGTSSFPSRPTIERIDRIHWEGRHLLMKLLEIEVPVISAINGPAWRHSEIPLLVRHRASPPIPRNSRIRRTSPPTWCLATAMHIVYPLLLGMNRGRYFLLTGQTLNAQKALELGLVAEVLPPDKLLARAWELAEDLARRPTLLLRYTRLCSPRRCAGRCMISWATGLAWSCSRSARSPKGLPRQEKLWRTRWTSVCRWCSPAMAGPTCRTERPGTRSSGSPGSPPTWASTCCGPWNTTSMTTRSVRTTSSSCPTWRRSAPMLDSVPPR